MTCQDAIALLSDYLEAVLDAASLESLEQHLRDCPPCQAYLNTFRRTRDLAAAAGRVEMPPEMRARLRRFLIERLEEPQA